MSSDSWYRPRPRRSRATASWEIRVRRSLAPRMRTRSSKVRAVGLQSLAEPAQPPVVGGEVVPDVERPFVIRAENALELGQQAQVQLERLAELAVRAQVGAVGVGAQQGDLVLLAVALLQQAEGLLDQLAGVGGVAVPVAWRSPTSTASVSTCRSSWPSRSRHTLSASCPNCIASTWPPRRCSRLTWSMMRRRRAGLLGVEEAPVGLEVLQRQIVDQRRCRPGRDCPDSTRPAGCPRPPGRRGTPRAGSAAADPW